MDLYIIRHAWAGEPGDPRWPNDDLRPLSEEGQERFAQMVARLAPREFAPQIIATSPLVRCAQTARIVAEHAPGRPKLAELEALAPGSNLETLLSWTSEQSRQHDRIAWVGHAPDVGRLAAALVGDGSGWIRFSKGGIAAIRFQAAPRAGEGELRWLVTAKVLGC